MPLQEDLYLSITFYKENEADRIRPIRRCEYSNALEKEETINYQ